MKQAHGTDAIPDGGTPLSEVRGAYALDGEVGLWGTATGLRVLAAGLSARGPGGTFPLAVPVGSAAPYDGFLSAIAVRPAEGKVRVGRAGTRLTIAGLPEFLADLAQNVTFAAELLEESAEDSRHVHIEYHPDHSYLDAASLPLVITAVRGFPQTASPW